MMIYEKEMVARMAHFTVAFFGYHLAGRQDLAEYFSKDHVAQQAVWLGKYMTNDTEFP